MSRSLIDDAEACRSSTLSYSRTSDTETAISNVPSLIRETSWNEAPRRDRIAATSTFVSSTTRTPLWYYQQYHEATKELHRSAICALRRRCRHARHRLQQLCHLVGLHHRRRPLVRLHARRL